MLNKLNFYGLTPVLLLVIALFSGFFTKVDAASEVIPKANNLQKDGINALEKGIPVLLEFSMHGCAFCEEIEAEVLRPMLISGDYDHKVLVRNVKIDEDHEIIDFNGKSISYEDLAARYNVFVTPTLVLVNADGEGMNLDMIGVTTIDFYGIYLDQAIDQAIKRVSTANKSELSSAGSPAS